MKIQLLCCGRKRNHFKIYTVGDNTDGALGDGNGKLLTATSSSDEMPRSYTLVEPLLPEGLNYSVLSSGQNYSLAITTDGKLYAWGRNKGGQLGDDTDVDMLPTSIYKSRYLFHVHKLKLMHL